MFAVPVTRENYINETIADILDKLCYVSYDYCDVMVVKKILVSMFSSTLKHQASSFKSVFEIVFVMNNYGRYGLALKLKLRFQTPPAKCRLGLSSKL